MLLHTIAFYEILVITYNAMKTMSDWDTELFQGVNAIAVSTTIIVIDILLQQSHYILVSLGMPLDLLHFIKYEHEIV